MEYLGLLLLPLFWAAIVPVHADGNIFGSGKWIGA